MKLNELTIKDASIGLLDKSFSAKELAEDCLAAIKEKDGEVHAYLEVFDDVLDQAKKADGQIANGFSSPLCGIPLAIKDNMLIGSRRTTAASKILENYYAVYDAAVIKKLKDRGAVFLGKTNMDEFAMGASTENSAFGSTKNPRDLTRVPGGSSGGSAAAVAGNMCIAALGSDTGGSIRQPAAFCGVVGLKPTYGAVSRHGLIAMASSLDQIGPLAKSVEDAEILFKAIAGRDERDSTSADLPATQKKEFKRIRIGVPKEYFGSGLDKETEKIIQSALRAAEKAGASIHDISLPHSSYALAAYYIIVPSEVSANLARFDGVRYGMGQDGDTLAEVYSKSRMHGFGPEVKRRIMLGTYALSAGYYDAYYVKAQKIRTLIREDFKKAFANVDIIAGPTAPTPAFRLGEKKDNPLEMYLSDIYTVAINLAGVPAISLPAGFVKEENSNLPIGLQLIGPWFQEPMLLDFAKQMEKLISY